MKQYFLGIELGSTRIKAVLIDEAHQIVKSGDTLLEPAARELEERKDYGYDEVMHRELLLAGKYGRPELDTVTLEDNNREE